MANAAYMESILLNFLTNAIKYKDPNRDPLIELNTFFKDDELVLRIKDNGLGIDLEKHRKDLFGMYKTFHGNADAEKTIARLILFSHTQSPQEILERQQLFLELLGEENYGWNWGSDRGAISKIDTATACSCQAQFHLVPCNDVWFET